MLYIAYGSNLNVDQMARRCPKAEMVGKALLPSYRLVFRGVADIEPAERAHVPVGIWNITDQCRIALDRYEGVSSGLYRREYIKLPRTAGRGLAGRRALVYLMNEDGYGLPSQGYFHTIAEGYKDFGLSLGFLFRALRYTTDQMERAYV